MKPPGRGRNLGSLSIIGAHYKVRSENGVLKFVRKYGRGDAREISVNLMDILIWRLTK